MSLEQMEIFTREHFLLSSSLLVQAEKLVANAPTETLRQQAEERYHHLLRLHRGVEERYHKLWHASSPDTDIKDENPPLAPLAHGEQ